MTSAHGEPPRTAGRRKPIPGYVILTLVLFLALPGAISLAACGSAGSPVADPSAAAARTAITAGVPKDESSEPPWNGRFVQVDVTAARPGQMRASDWHVFVDGKAPQLEKPATILPYAPHAALVAFVFRAPYTELGTYRFRVVYAPEGGPRVERSWDYKW